MLSRYIVLSRKYRPKDLKDLIGQDVLVRSLKSCLDNNKVPHAFLFHGIRGVGKTTTARILARCLNCVGHDEPEQTTSSPCGTCRSCVAMDSDNHLDVMEFDAASRTGVEDIREIIEASQYSPVVGKFKIFIIDEVHMLSKNAFNALLKILEEPPLHVKFIFATTELHKIPETILSRCITFQLNPVRLSAVADHLVTISQKEGFALSKSAADVISEESEGSVRDALSILDQAMMLSQETKDIEEDSVISMLGSVRSSDISNLLGLILAAKTKESLDKTDSLLQNGCDPCMLFKRLQTALYREIVENVRNTDKLAISNLLHIWQVLLGQTENMKQAARPGYVLVAAIAILAHTASFPQIEELMIKKPPSKGNLVNDILSKFPGSKATEIE
ncbi:MAG: DNA polymerase III subunit gamma/tau [Holosporales bacterium]|jgi:DNA polymerase-3 subunit gamma/tau|nr:DNA polymerase III subunit gamma/tau [Holosporales bacterium]